MKHLIKYILLVAVVFCLALKVDAQKKRKNTKKVSNKTATKTKAKKTAKGGKKKTVELNSTTEKPIANIDATSNNVKKTEAVKLDSVPEKVVTILSDFKPQLKNLAKINFNNATVQNDTTTLHIDYNVPSQNLTFHYKPISLVPRSYRADTLIHANNNGSLKLGFGNYLQREIDANYNFVDAYDNNHSFNLYNNAYNGLHHLQSLNEIGFNYLNSIYINADNRIISKLYYKQSERNRYGMVPDSTLFPITNYKQNYYLTGGSISWMNENKNNNNMHYKPILSFEHFEGFTGATNNWVELKNNLSIIYKNGINFNIDVDYSYNQLNAKQNNVDNNKNNSYLSLMPSIELNKFNSDIDLGVSPTILNGKFNLFPLVAFKRKLADSNYIFKAGWNTQVLNNQYTTLVTTNPWINVPTNIDITTNDKKYIEVQINAGKRLDYGFNFSLNNYKNLPLFNRVTNVNPLYNGLMYNALFEKEASTIELAANLRYQFSDKLLILNNFKYIQFNSLLENAKPWGILPMELDSKINWLPNSKWNIAGSVKFWTGATMLNDKKLPVDMKNAFVLNAMVQYKLTSNWSTWVKGENLLDRPYERWLDYPSLGVQILGGVVYSFRK
ncbi:MAG: hypothetical protein RIR55_254 [Bacteroidota bacterium]